MIVPNQAALGPGRYGTCEGHPRPAPDYASEKDFTHRLTEYGNEPTPDRYLAVKAAHDRVVAEARVVKPQP